MALVKALILPHSPLLIPEIGRTNHVFLEKTSLIYQKINTELKDLALDTLIVISPHSLSSADAFNFNVAPEMTVNFQDFGFIPPKNVLAGDALLLDKIKNALRPNFKLDLSSESGLDYGSAIPIYLLNNPETNFKIIVITPAENLDLEAQYNFGLVLQEVIQASPKKIAVIASGDLSHRLKKKSPGGYSPKGARFDNRLIECLSEPETAVSNILKINNKLIAEAGECGLKAIMILLGVSANLVNDSKVLAYQTDFGIGYLSLELKLITSHA